jgi:hypothetical protein
LLCLITILGCLPFTVLAEEGPVIVEQPQDCYVSVGERISITVAAEGENLRYQYSTGTVGYDTTSRQWYFRPSQAETLAAEADQYEVIARVKYANHINADVRGVNIGRISIEDGLSEEVI